MPIKRFWLLSESIDRIQSQQQLSNLSTIASSRNPESFTNLTDNLSETIGTVVVAITTERDPQAKEILQNLMKK